MDLILRLRNFLKACKIGGFTYGNTRIKKKSKLANN